MAYTAVLERSTDGGSTWTTLTTIGSNGGYLVDWVSESPNPQNASGPITVTYRFRISGGASDVVGPRRLAGIAGNR